MKASYLSFMPRAIVNVAAIGILAAAMCFSAFAQQDPYQPGPPQQQNNQPYPSQGYPGQQGPDPYSNNQAPPPPYQSNGPGAGPNSAPAGQPAPASLTMQAGTLIPVRVTQLLSSDKSLVGANFTATLDAPLVVDGWVVERIGQTVMGRVAIARSAGNGNGQSQLGLQLTGLNLVDGQQFFIQAQLIQGFGDTPNGQQPTAVRVTPITTGAGTVGVISRNGIATVIAPDMVLTFRVSASAAISTARNNMAFQQVSQADYGGDPNAQDPPQGAPQGAYDPANPYPSEQQAGPGPGYPPAPPLVYGYPPYPYYYPPYYGFYPGFSIGFYGGYYGRGYYGYRGYYGGGYRRR